jgi:hypothetical protein
MEMGRVSWRVSGSYLESCNCGGDLSVPPDRRVMERASSHGHLPRRALRGRMSTGTPAGTGSRARRRAGLPLQRRRGGLAVELRASTSTSGATRAQRTALEAIFTGGCPAPRSIIPLGVEGERPRPCASAAIEIEHVPGRGWFRAGRLRRRRSRAVEGDSRSHAVTPGHQEPHRPARSSRRRSTSTDGPARVLVSRTNWRYESGLRLPPARALGDAPFGEVRPSARASGCRRRETRSTSSWGRPPVVGVRLRNRLHQRNHDLPESLIRTATQSACSSKYSSRSVTSFESRRVPQPSPPPSRPRS